MRINGKVRNPDNGQSYEVTDLKVKMAQSTESPQKFELQLDDVEHTQWLKQKADERKQKFATKPLPQTERKGIRVS